MVWWFDSIMHVWHQWWRQDAAPHCIEHFSGNESSSLTNISINYQLFCKFKLKSPDLHCCGFRFRWSPRNALNPCQELSKLLLCQPGFLPPQKAEKMQMNHSRRKVWAPPFGLCLWPLGTYRLSNWGHRRTVVTSSSQVRLTLLSPLKSEPENCHLECQCPTLIKFGCLRAKQMTKMLCIYLLWAVGHQPSVNFRRIQLRMGHPATLDSFASGSQQWHKCGFTCSCLQKKPFPLMKVSQQVSLENQGMFCTVQRETVLGLKKVGQGWNPRSLCYLYDSTAHGLLVTV